MSTNKPRCLFLDTYYPEFLNTLSPKLSAGFSYDEALSLTMRTMFGTGDSYSHYLKLNGWDTADVIGNFDKLQKRWHGEQNFDWVYNDAKGIALQQIKAFAPDVLFLQDLSFFEPALIGFIREEYGVKLVAGQLSCPWPGDDRVSVCDVIFTSFPHYVSMIKAAGSRGYYSRLAFDPRLLKMIDTTRQRRINGAVFVGGIGYPSHWKYGLEVLETVAQQVDEFCWYGYGVETLPDSMALKKKYRGQAWGLDMYQLLADYSIVINRHGEVAQNYANNMKLYETTGMGAALITDHKENLSDMFDTLEECVPYTSAQQCSDLVRFYLENPSRAREVGTKGQIRTLMEHTYENKMRFISDTLGDRL